MEERDLKLSDRTTRLSLLPSLSLYLSIYLACCWCLYQAFMLKYHFLSTKLSPDSSSVLNALYRVLQVVIARGCCSTSSDVHNLSRCSEPALLLVMLLLLLLGPTGLPEIAVHNHVCRVFKGARDRARKAASIIEFCRLRSHQRWWQLTRRISIAELPGCYRPLSRSMTGKRLTERLRGREAALQRGVSEPKDQWLSVPKGNKTRPAERGDKSLEWERLTETTNFSNFLITQWGDEPQVSKCRSSVAMGQI